MHQRWANCLVWLSQALMYVLLFHYWILFISQRPCSLRNLSIVLVLIRVNLTICWKVYNVPLIQLREFLHTRTFVFLSSHTCVRKQSTDSSDSSISLARILLLILWVKSYSPTIAGISPEQFLVRPETLCSSDLQLLPKVINETFANSSTHQLTSPCDSCSEQ